MLLFCGLAWAKSITTNWLRLLITLIMLLIEDAFEAIMNILLIGGSNLPLLDEPATANSYCSFFCMTRRNLAFVGVTGAVFVYWTVRQIRPILIMREASQEELDEFCKYGLLG